jgi:glutamate/tyrosine decarboxylase-like PLP-dependent enzyme
MLYEVAHWFWNWLIGYGGILLLVVVALWLLWYFTPAFLLSSKTTIFHAALIATGIDVASTYMSAHYFNQGYRVAINQVAANTKETKDAITKAGQSIDDCNSRGGTWSTVDGMCDR